LVQENEKLKEEQEKLTQQLNLGAEVAEVIVNDSLVDLLNRVLEQNKLKKESFLYKLIQQQLLCLDIGDSRGFRWDRDIILWAMTIQFHGGKLVIDRIRGKGNEGQGNHGHLEVDLNGWNLFIPANSTLRSYLPHVNCYQGIEDRVIADIKSAVKSANRTGGISFDEIEIKGSSFIF